MGNYRGGFQLWLGDISQGDGFKLPVVCQDWWNIVKVVFFFLVVANYM